MSTEHPETACWVVINFGRFYHVVPKSEVNDHHPQDCRCQPLPDDDYETVIIHNAFDGREKFERGERRAS